MDDPGFRKGLYLSIEPQGPNMPQGERDRHAERGCGKACSGFVSQAPRIGLRSRRIEEETAI
jgi:hypothetical protein